MQEKQLTWREVLDWLGAMEVGLSLTLFGVGLTVLALLLSHRHNRKSKDMQGRLEKLIRDLISETREIRNTNDMIKSLQKDIIVPLARSSSPPRVDEEKTHPGIDREPDDPPKALPRELANVLRSWRRYPPRYVLLASIERSNVDSVEALEVHCPELRFFDSIDAGVRQLLTARILTGQVDDFRLNSSWNVDLRSWLSGNRQTIGRIAELYEQQHEGAKSSAKELAMELTGLG